jgi:hypothetical protein
LFASPLGNEPEDIDFTVREGVLYRVFGNSLRDGERQRLFSRLDCQCAVMWPRVLMGLPWLFANIDEPSLNEYATLACRGSSARPSSFRDVLELANSLGAARVRR